VKEGRRYGEFGVRGSMMGESKQIRISSLKSLIIAFLSSEYTEVLESPS
jgi:hypothetical protein